MIANQRVNPMMRVQNLGILPRNQRTKMKMMQVMKRNGQAVMRRRQMVAIMMKLMCKKGLKQH